MSLSKMMTDLRSIRKYRLARHRLYIKGRNQDCHYCVGHIMLNKRKEDDNPGTKRFQNMILRSLEGEEFLLELPQPEPGEDDPDQAG